jgi:hypothetical protein
VQDSFFDAFFLNKRVFFHFRSCSYNCKFF